MARKAQARSAPAQPKATPTMRIPDGISKQAQDSLENLITGLGTSRDKATGTTFTFLEMNKAQLEAAYRGDWIARKVVNIPAQDATREWRDWQSDKADISKLEALEKQLNLQTKTQQALKKARLYGGSALLLGVDTGDLEKELFAERVGKDSLKFIHVVSRYELTAGEIEWDLESEFYGTPKWYTRAGQGGMGQKVHPSRVVRFVGNDIPDAASSGMAQGWGDPVLQVVQDALIAAGTACAAGAQLLQEIKMDIIKVPDLTSSLAMKGGEQRLQSRFAAANVAKSLFNILLLDKEEEWNRITATMTGVPDTLQMYLMIASGAADIPTTRMLGQSPAGLNSTGESDLRNYYDHVRSNQKTELQTGMSRLDEILIRSALGTNKPEDIFYEWRPLWQLDDQAASTILAQKAASFKIDVDAGLIPGEVLRDARINQLIEDGVYPGLETILDDYGPLEDPDDVPEPGAIIGPNGEAINPSDPKHPNNPANPQNQAVANENAAPAPGGIAQRAAKAPTKRVRDARARTLYVSRRVLNAGALRAWAAKQGIPDLEPSKELHVTVIFSGNAVDWAKAGASWAPGENKDGTLTIPPGGMRMVEKFGNAIVLLFACNELSYRHMDIRERTGAEPTHKEYQPHVTVSYTEAPIDLDKLEAYQGEIQLGPEIFAEADASY